MIRRVSSRAKVCVIMGTLLAGIGYIGGGDRLFGSCNELEYRQYDAFMFGDDTLPAVYKKTECISVYDNTADGNARDFVTPREKRMTATADSGEENTDCNPAETPTIATYTFDGDFVEGVGDRRYCYWKT